MMINDFEYCGKKLSSMGMLLCTFSGNNDEIDVANEIDMGDTKPGRSDIYNSIGSGYTSPLEYTFSICKDPCDNPDGDIVLSDEQCNQIIRWLNRKSYGKFVPFYDDESFNNVYCMATFNLEAVRANEGIIGFNLTMHTNAPYCFKNEKTFDFLNTTTFTIIDASDEVNHIYADVDIQPLSAGKLTITNSLDPNNVIEIKNCEANETITFHGRLKQISTDSDSHLNTLFDDFNFKFPRVMNTYTNAENIFTLSLPCNVSLKYSPVRKIALV